jgi:exopolysaccharide biosynthesis polyprenyl glycosylphosphotransferase
MTAGAFMLGYKMRQWLPVSATPVEVIGFMNYVPMMIVQIITVVLVFYINRLYHVVRAHSRADQFFSVAGAVSVSNMFSVAISALTFKNSAFELDFPRAMILYGWVIGIVLVVMGRETHRTIWREIRKRGLLRDRVLVIGSGQNAVDIVKIIKQSPELGYELVGVVSHDDRRHIVQRARFLGTIREIGGILDTQEIQEVIIALPQGTSYTTLTHIVSLCQRASISIKIFPDLFQFMATGLTIDDLGGIPLLSMRDIQLRGWLLSIKRGMDMLGAGLGLIFLSPLMLFFALMIRLESPGPVFYLQERMGLDGKAFYMIKFRSMRVDAEKMGPGWTVENDPRRTKLGTFLRSKNIDELPQLINVLMGDMTLVGPRPERPVYVEQFRQSIPRYMERHREKAGMTGWAQVNGLRGDTSIDERTKFDLWYVENWSLWLDVKIIIRTILQSIFFSAEKGDENGNGNGKDQQGTTVPVQSGNESQ